MAKIMFEFTICSDNWEPNGIIKFLGIERKFSYRIKSYD